jgi:hypothetical protein
VNLQAHVNSSVIPWLHSPDAANLVWWTEAQFYQWIDHITRTLARDALLFVTAELGIVVSPGTNSYAVPTGHICTLYALSLPPGPGAPYALSPVTVGELEALSSFWPADEGLRPLRFVHDVGLDQITFYPKTVTGGAVHNIMLIYAKHLPEVVAIAPTIPAPEVLRPIFLLHALAEAMGHEGEGRMVETAQAIRPFENLLVETARRYFSE